MTTRKHVHEDIFDADPGWDPAVLLYSSSVTRRLFYFR